MKTRSKKNKSKILINSPSRQTSRLLHFQHGCTTLPFLRPSPLRRAQRMPQGGRGVFPGAGTLGTVQIRFGGALRAKQEGPVVWDSKGAKPQARNSPLTWVFVFQLFLVDTKNRIHHPVEAPCGWTKVSGFQRRLNSS